MKACQPKALYRSLCCLRCIKVIVSATGSEDFGCLPYVKAGMPFAFFEPGFVRGFVHDVSGYARLRKLVAMGI